MIKRKPLCGALSRFLFVQLSMTHKKVKLKWSKENNRTEMEGVREGLKY